MLVKINIISLEKNKTEKRDFKKFFTISFWAYKEIFAIAPFDTILIFVSYLVNSLVPISNAFIYSKLVDEILKLITDKKTSDLFSLNSNLTILIGISTIFYIVQSILGNFQNYLQYKFSLVHYLKQETKLYTKIAGLDLEKIEDPNFSDEIKRAKTDLNKVRQFMNISLKLFANITALLAALIVVWNSSTLIALTTILASLPSGIVGFVYAKRYFNFTKDNTQEFRKKNFYLDNIINESNFSQNKAFQTLPFFMAKFNKISEILNNKEMTLQKDERVRSLITSLTTRLNDIFVTYFFALQAISGLISFGQFNFLTGRVSQLSQRFDLVLYDFSTYIDYYLSIESVKKVLEIKNKINSGSQKLNTGVHTIEFRKVYFKYPNSKNYIFQNLNMVINPNEEIAIVGQNGAGKSTLIKLLLRLYDVDKGEILVDGINVKNLDIENYYKQIGILFQEFTMYGVLSIKENIVLNSPKKFSNKGLNNAVDLAEAGSFISKLRFGFDTLLNKTLDKGQVFSSGQKQKIALARMFYRDAPILILDEPTASIDPVSEYNIFKRIYKFMTNKTVIIISHRFSTVRNAQKIYVLDKGKIVEQGSHSELMKLNGKYAFAFNKQAEGYTKT